MSSRALRRLQRQRDEEEQISAPHSSEDEEAAQAKPNAFDLLGAEDDERSSSSENPQPPSEQRSIEQASSSKSAKKRKKKKKAKAGVEPDSGADVNEEEPGDNAKQTTIFQGEGHLVDSPADTGSPGVSTSARRKKNRGKKKQSTKPSQDAEESLLDQILATDRTNSGSLAEKDAQLQVEKHEDLLLAVDSKELNPMNEMKRLFGNVVLEAERENQAVPGSGRRRGMVQQVDLGGAIARRHSMQRGSGQRAAAVGTLRRNVFMPGKEEWPRAPSGGLGMEVVEDIGGDVIYEFVHNNAYQDTQRQFYICVESMDPQRMITLLQHNPYHVATLLQVSEIAKQQGDHSVSADLLERALFTFGRSVHSTFGTNLREGLARLDFIVQENREFWLTAWRYISNLCRRGTWRSAYEWAKLLLSLDQDNDPYGITLLIDQLAIRSSSHEHFIKLCESQKFRALWFESRPNLQISLALAYFKAGKQEECRAQLEHCISKYAWMFARLFKDLNIDHIPKSIWGSQPETEYQSLICELYVSRAKDLWNSPEVLSLLKDTAGLDLPRAETDLNTRSVIGESEARHAFLLEDPSLIALLPATYKSRYGSPNDLLPPINPFSRDLETDTDEENQTETRPAPSTNPVRHAGDDGRFVMVGSDNTWLDRLLEFMRLRNGPSDDAEERSPQEYLEQMLQSAQQGELQGIEPQAEITNDHQATVEDDFWDLVPDEAFRAPTLVDDGPVLETSEEADQRVQRFLAGRGLQALRDFVSVNGVDEGNWAGDLDQKPLTDYASSVVALRTRTTRQFILNYILPQGTSSVVKDLVIRKAESLEPGSTR
jgi:hypothetical protein